MKTGQELKEEGIARVAANSAEFQEAAADVILLLAGTAFPFTAEDVRKDLAVMGYYPPHPNAMGAAISIASKRGIIEPVAFNNARRASAHSRLLITWKGVDRGA